ncbi:MAG: flagellar basal body P-ring formation protein FlgA [Burkholderiaceae bacterium]|nr:flagellar basal body P-ring formation protein FlgA [Roseateles sp.]MBV8471568.1 flagellar basal body P-ring formation protein FlgA [Burkholderiaceae bacterium]
MPSLAQSAAGEGVPLLADSLKPAQSLAEQAAQAAMPEGARVEVDLGNLDPRLHLAPCRRTEPYLPPGLKMWGRSRIGVRCIEGVSRWNVSIPIVVHVYAKAMVAAKPLGLGTILTQAQLQTAEVDIAADNSPAYLQVSELEGRVLARPLAAGEVVRLSDLRTRLWFAAGDRVTVTANGPGYAVSSEGSAMERGMEGQEVKVKFDNGRISVGRAVGERRVEVDL